MRASVYGKTVLSVTGMICLLFLFGSALAQTQRPKIATNSTSSYTHAYQHGYRAGYEDGFAKGKEDFGAGQPRDFTNNDYYKAADRGYTDDMGTRLEFQESYRIGFEMGHGDGYYGRPYSVTMPTNLGKTVIAAVNAAGGDLATERTRPRNADDQRDQNDRDQGDRDRDRDRDRNQNQQQSQQDDRQDRRSSKRGSDSNFSFRVPDGVEMKIRLTTAIDTRTNRQGDRFTATVIDPSDYADGVVEGYISKLNKSGKATGKTEMSLAFDSIQMRDGRTGKMAGQ
ncbi:MAG: hypothetical protein J2P41_18995, partial [Blastocatellia bacterium]|nr:hypothetical protein [Blastocatellia bacterium]